MIDLSCIAANTKVGGYPKMPTYNQQQARNQSNIDLGEEELFPGLPAEQMSNDKNIITVMKNKQKNKKSKYKKHQSHNVWDDNDFPAPNEVGQVQASQKVEQVQKAVEKVVTKENIK